MMKAMLLLAMCGTAVAIKMPRRLNAAMCSDGQMVASSMGAFEGASQGQPGWATKSAYELTHNTKTTGYGDAGQYVNGATCKLQATTCGAGYTHNDYALAKKQTGADVACVKCPDGKWVRSRNEQERGSPARLMRLLARPFRTGWSEWGWGGAGTRVPPPGVCACCV